MAAAVAGGRKIHCPADFKFLTSITNKLKFVGQCPTAVPTSVPSSKPLFSKGLTRLSRGFAKKTVSHVCDRCKSFSLLGLPFRIGSCAMGQPDLELRIRDCEVHEKNSCQPSAFSYQPERKYCISKSQTGSYVRFTIFSRMFHGLSIFLLMRRNAKNKPGKERIDTSDKCYAAEPFPAADAVFAARMSTLSI